MIKTPSLPLCVDLDGTLIKTDVLQEMLLIYVYRWPFKILNLILWLLRGRAYLKQQLAQRIDIAAYPLPYHHAFLQWLRGQKLMGRQLILVTASDQRPAQTIANQVGIFNDVMASDGKRNLRADCKARALVSRFGSNKFAYAGNSKDDLKVWIDSGEIIAVNTPLAILFQAQSMPKPLMVFANSQAPSMFKLYFSNSIWHWVFFLLLIFVGVSLRKYSLLQLCLTSVLAAHVTISAHNLFNLVTMRSRPLIPISKSSPLVHALQNGQVDIARIFKINIIILFIASCVVIIN